MLLLSRVADALYWISRYLERAEHVARVIDVRLDLGLDRRSPATAGISAARTPACASPPRTSSPATPTALVEQRCSTAANRESVVACVTAARDNARQVREEISSDMWEHLNGLFLDASRRRDRSRSAAAALSRRSSSSKACSCSRASPTRRWDMAKGGSYLQVGRFLERADGDRGAARFALSRRPRRRRQRIGRSTIECAGLLRSCSALEAYCRHYTADVRPERVAEFLLLNPEFPRSVRFAASQRRNVAARDCAVHVRARRRRDGRAARGPAARLARLRPGRRDPQRQIRTRFSQGIGRSARRFTARSTRSTSRIRSSRRCRRSRIPADHRCSTRFATSRSSSTTRRSPRASWKRGCSRAATARSAACISA